MNSQSTGQDAAVTEIRHSRIFEGASLEEGAMPRRRKAAFGSTSFTQIVLIYSKTWLTRRRRMFR